MHYDVLLVGLRTHLSSFKQMHLAANPVKVASSASTLQYGAGRLSIGSTAAK